MAQGREAEIRRQFLDEAQEYLQTLDQALLGLGNGAIDVQKINAALRVTHSIKGGSGMMGYLELSDLAHQLEDALKALKLQSNLKVTLDLESLFLAAVDALTQLVDGYRQTDALDPHWLVGEVRPIFAQLRSHLGAPPAETAASVLLPEDNPDIAGLIFETEVEDALQRLESLLETDPDSLQQAAITLAQELGSLGEMLQLPSFTQLCGEIEQSLSRSSDPVATATTALQTWRQAQSALLGGQPQQMPTALPAPRSVAPVAATPDEDSTVRVSVRDLNHLNDWFGELVIDRSGLELYFQRFRGLSRTLHQRLIALDRVNSQLRAASERATFAPAQFLPSSQFDSLELDRYDDLHALSQQIMEAIAQLQEVSDDLGLSLDDAEQSSRSLKKTIKQLQVGLTRLRMRPFSDVVERFPRALREWCLQYGKQVSLQLVGGDLLIDRTILEALQDPLMHLMRNAFDHGIEDPETRLHQGKPPVGTIEIQAVQNGSRIQITLRDDGRGIAIAKIRQRAEQLGLDSALLAAASNTELLALIFEPGFSTSDELTALSGRGVGMDVVRSNLKQIRGEISVDTQVNRGTTFTLSVPSTLLTVRILLVETSGMLLALPTEAISALILRQAAAVSGQEFAHKGQQLSLFPIDRWLAFNSPRSPHRLEAPPMVDRPSIVIATHNQQQVGLPIDRCWSEQEATVRQVEGALPLPSGLSGCTILSDGRVVPLVNLAELMQWSQSYANGSAPTRARLKVSAPRPVASIPPHQPSNLLIVDDSINVRRFLALTLERAGYRVEQAQDGQEALEQLEQGLTVKAIICDVEMPRLDGYEFLAKLKANPTLKHIPIAMLTSRSGEKHRQWAMQLGAAAFFPKPYNEQTLLRTLKTMVAQAS
jgi:chemosensory pili system protein ChpA (sensor histidine kinase/response regulator)